uniref:Uncharacterized protein n=1 Tax=Anguilla anguilla TaxID=7936 RepID=A0A0E9R699_ANGAN
MRRENSQRIHQRLDSLLIKQTLILHTDVVHLISER